MTINIATEMLTSSAKAIAERQAKYGPPDKNFACIAALWQGYLRGKYGELATLTIDAADVAAMSALIKVARLAETPAHEDSWVDLAGYAACGRQVTAPGDTGQMQTTEPWYTYGGNFQSVDVAALSRTIDGARDGLAESIEWSNTPQGGEYWKVRHHNGGLISNKDRLYLLWLRDEAIKHQKTA